MINKPTVPKNTNKPTDVSHPGMTGRSKMSVSAENPAAGIKKDEVDVAFVKQNPRSGPEALSH